jgi:hypothetical protein
MRLNGNQIEALEALRLEDFFHFDIEEDALDRRVARVKAWDFHFEELREVEIDENGTVFERTRV